MWAALACACGLGVSQAPGQGGLEALRGRAGGPPALSDALASIAQALTDRATASDRQQTTLVVPARQSPLDCYAAQVLPVHLRGLGWPDVRISGGLELNLPWGEGLPRQLPPRVEFALRDAASAVVVKAETDDEGAGGELHVALYGLDRGRRQARASVRFSLPPGRRLLLSAPQDGWKAGDREWLELLDELFAPAPTDGMETAAGVALEEGLYLFRQGFWKEAAQRLAAVSKPSANGRFLRAVMALQLCGQAQQARDAVQAALEKHPDSGPLYALRGWLLFRAGSPTDAVILLGQARVYDVAREGYYRYAEALLALEGKDSEKAEKALLKASELLPERAFPHSKLARLYWNKARLEQAVKFYRRAADAETENAGVWAELGMASDASGELDGAIEAFGKAFSLAPTRLHVARQLSLLLERKGEYVRALTVLHGAAQANPYDTAVLATYGDAAARRWLLDEAAEAFSAAVKSDQGFAYGKVRLARVLALERRYDEAEAALRQVLQEHPDYGPAVVALGQLLAERGRAGEAVSLLSAAAVEPEQQAPRNLALARAYLAAGRHDLAVRHAQIAVSASAGPDSYGALACIFLASGDLEKAQIAANNAIESGPKSGAAHLVMARLLHASGDRQKAIELCRQAVECDPFLAEAFRFWGQLYEEAEDYGRCAEMWKKALELDRWDAELHWRLAELLERRIRDRAGAALHYRRHRELGGAGAR